MAMKVKPLWIGVDVSKAKLDVATSATPDVHQLPNQAKDIRRWLASLTGPVCIALEATNTFHLEVAIQAHALGFTVYLLDGYRLNRYRESIGGRAKTDASDARLLLRYVQHEHEDLRAWSPPPKGYVTLQRLLHRRAVLVQSRTALRQSLAGVPGMKASVKALLKNISHLDTLICRRIQKTLSSLDWADEARRCRDIEGVGSMTSAALTMIFHRGTFKSADAFIAFIGMDVRVRESGTYRGRRKLTKKGDPELRRLLYMAAMTACTSASWQPYYQRCLARGMSCIQALVALGRKLARIAFALLKTGATYRPKHAHAPCVTA